MKGSSASATIIVMKQIVKLIFLYSFSLFISSLLFSGLGIKGGFEVYFYAAAILAVLNLLLDPLIKLITLPFNILTLGLLSFLTTLVSLFILTLVFRNVTVESFTFSGISFMGVEIKKVFVPGILSYVVISATIYFLNRIISWLFTK